MRRELSDLIERFDPNILLPYIIMSNFKNHEQDTDMVLLYYEMLISYNANKTKSNQSAQKSYMHHIEFPNI